jgi:hypothetical protein
VEKVRKPKTSTVEQSLHKHIPRPIAIRVIVVSVVCAQVAMALWISLRNFGYMFFGSVVTQVSMPSAASIVGTFHIHPFFLYAPLGSFGERLGLEVFLASIQSLTGLSIYEVTLIATVLMCFIPVIGTYVLAIKISKNRKIGFLSMLLFSSAILPPLITHDFVYSFVFFPIFLYATLTFLEGKLSFLALIPISVLGMSIHPMQLAALMLVAVYGVFKAFFNNREHKDIRKYLALILLFPLTVLLFFPIFYGVSYPEAYLKPGESMVNSPFDFYLVSVVTLWNSPAFFSLFFKAFLIILAVIPILGYVFRSRLPIKFPENFSVRSSLSKIGQLAKNKYWFILLLFLLTFCAAMVQSGFNVSNAVISYGEFTYRPIFYPFAALLLISVFSIIFVKEKTFLFFFYIAIIVQLIRPITSVAHFGLLLQFQMDRGYYFTMFAVAIGTAAVFVRLYEAKISSVPSRLKRIDLKKLSALVLIVLIVAMTVTSLLAVQDYFANPTKVDSSFVDAVSYLRPRVSSDDKIYSDYPFFDALMFPGINLLQSTNIQYARTAYDFWQLAAKDNLTYLVVQNPNAYPSESLNNTIYSTVYNKGGVTILHINQTLLENYLVSEPLQRPVTASWNEDFENYQNLQSVSIWQATNNSIAVNNVHAKEGNSSMLLNWFSSEKGVGTAAIQEKLGSPVNMTSQQFRFWINIPAAYYDNVSKFSLSMIDSQGVRAQMWEWSTSSIFPESTFSTGQDTWYSFDVKVGESSGSTHWEEDSGNISDVSSVLFGGSTRGPDQTGGILFDSFTMIAPCYGIEITVHDSADRILPNATVDALYKGNDVASEKTTADGSAILYLPSDQEYSFNVRFDNLLYKNIYNVTLNSNSKETVKLADNYLG